jgi:hypothetical protein
MLECSNLTHNCALCSYTTQRKYNYDRHINIVHNVQFESQIINAEKNVLNVKQNVLNVNSYKCNTCYKHFLSKVTLKRHISRCNHRQIPNQCIDCLKVLSSRTTLAHHKKCCKGVPNNNLNVNILPFPLTREETFDFNCDNISYTVLKYILQNTNDSFIRFNRFIEKIFENPQNLIIRKSSPEDNYSSIHLGNNNWELAYDKDILPILIYHIAATAIRKIIKIQKQVPLLMDVIKEFQNEVTEITEMDYNKDEYKDIIERIKIKIVNITPELVKEKEYKE